MSCILGLCGCEQNINDEVENKKEIFDEFSESQEILNVHISFSELENLNFAFLSDTGAWCTEMTIAADGSFQGVYQDSDMDFQTEYYCDFQGEFSQPVQKYTYIYISDKREYRLDGMVFTSKPVF